MKCSLEKIIEDVQLLLSRIESRESATDHLLQQIVQVQSDLLSMRKYQEEVRSFNELSERLSNHPKGPLIRCLAAENKQLEQLQIENRALCTSLDEHQSALDLIMKKYRSQVTKLMQANQLESTLKSSTTISSGETNHSTADNHSPSESTDPVNCAPSTISESSNSDTTLLTQRMSALAAMAQDVCDRGDAYTAELEAELHRLRSENAGLREMLMISTDYSSADSADNVANLDPIPGASYTGYKQRHMRYLLQKQPNYGSDSSSHISGRGVSVGGSYSRPFDALSSPRSYEFHQVGYREVLSDADEKDDIITQCELDEDEMDKSYDNTSSDSTVIADSDHEHMYEMQ